MSCDEELDELARLLRLGAEAARNIAYIRKANAVEIERLADQADAIAEEIANIIRPISRLQQPRSGVH